MGRHQSVPFLWPLERGDGRGLPRRCWSGWMRAEWLPGNGIVWTAVDGSSARATMTDDPISVSMLFCFGADGLIAAIHLYAGARKVGDATVLMQWEYRISNHRAQDKMRIPRTGAALYITEQGKKPHFKWARNTTIREFGP